MRWLPPVLAASALLSLSGGTGFGLTQATVAPQTNVLPTISLTAPGALHASPPVCTNALAPLDTDDCTDVRFTTGSPARLDLGALSGNDVQAASLRWRVTTTSRTGYSVLLQNVNSGSVLRAGSSSISDMPSGMTAAASVPNATHFGVAAGDPATDAEAAVAYPGSSWVTAGGQHGERFRGVPTGGVVVAQRATPRTNDPFTLTLAAASTAANAPASGSYTGTLRLTASVI